MSKIIILPPEERVRHRPNVVFPSGSKQVFIDIFKILLAEVHHGYCSRIDIILFKDGNINMINNGRGFLIGNGDDQWKKMVIGAYMFLEKR